MTDAGYRVRFRYEGGEADNHRLDLYDGTKSIYGFARTLQIATHAFVNKEVINHATALKGAEIFLLPAQRGSFLNDVLIALKSSPVAPSVTASALYDFIRYSVGKATGKAVEPSTPYVAKLRTDEPFFDSLAESMEGALVEGHRTIQESGGTVTLERPRSDLLVFDVRTLEWVKTRDENPDEEIITGNVTRFNVISKNGRLYDHALSSTVPFFADDTLMTNQDRHLLTWSLDQVNTGFPGVLDFRVKRIVSARGDTKRYILVGCSKASDQKMVDLLDEMSA